MQRRTQDKRAVVRLSLKCEAVNKYTVTFAQIHLFWVLPHAAFELKRDFSKPLCTPAKVTETAARNCIGVPGCLMQGRFAVYDHKHPKYLGREFNHGHCLSHVFFSGYGPVMK